MGDFPTIEAAYEIARIVRENERKKIAGYFRMTGGSRSPSERSRCKVADDGYVCLPCDEGMLVCDREDIADLIERLP